MNRRKQTAATTLGITAFGAAALLACANIDVLGLTTGNSYEAWVMDQSPSPGRTYGGQLHIFSDSSVGRGVTTLANARETIDLAGETASLCQSQTGALPVQPHNITFNRTQSHAIVAFLASGHVAILDARTRKPVACLQMTPGAGGMRHAHQAVSAPDGSYILVANQMGKLIERIDADFRTNTFTHNSAATINLLSCQTPSGVACEGAGIRPNNQPVTFSMDENGNLAFVTLRGGGFFVINPRTTPMQIRAAYDVATIQAQGLASINIGGRVYTTSGANAFRLYRFSVADFAANSGASNPTPDNLMSETGTSHDAHSITAAGDNRYLWVTDRGNNTIEVFDLASNTHVTTMNLGGTLTADPAPDLLATSPAGDLMFVTLKGPNPLSGVPWGTGSTPGLGIIVIDQNGRSGRLQEIRAINNPDANGVERADPHGLAIRRR